MLELNSSFFDYLNSNHVRYCHWKSNGRLTQALNGETDLDILVDEKDQAIFESVLRKFEFKKILSVPAKRIPDVEDYLGLDYASGKLIHLHVHYKLVLGQRYIKNHHLPIENLIFDHLIRKSCVQIPCPEMELIILIIRANMKVGLDSIIKHAVNVLRGKQCTPYPSDIEREIDELISACDMDQLKRLVHESQLPLSQDIFTKFIDRFLKKDLGLYEMMRWRRQILRRLKAYRREKGLAVVIKYYMLFIQNLPFIHGFFKSRRKTLIGRGRVISIVGADGSGKSTIVNDLCKWLSWKLDVRRVYFGIPKTGLVKSSSLAIRGFNKLRLRSMAGLLNSLLWIYIARRRYKLFIQSRIHTKMCRVVITDRFPLKEFRGMEEPMDGPRLLSLRSTAFHRFFKLEEYFYDRILLPDRIFVLQAHVDELRRRKADLAFDQHVIKAETVNALVESSVISVMDANRPYAEVLLEVKRKIWGLI